MYVKKCRRVLLERRRGREEEIRRSSKKMAYKMAFATRSPSGSLVHRDTDAFFFCRPLPTRASGILLPFIFSPGYLFASVLLLYALFRHMLNARSRVQARVSHLCTKGEERRRKLAALCYILRARFPFAGVPRESRDREGRKAEKEKCKAKRDFVS